MPTLSFTDKVGILYKSPIKFQVAAVTSDKIMRRSINDVKLMSSFIKFTI